jgi:hypothetical protein
MGQDGEAFGIRTPLDDLQVPLTLLFAPGG